MSEYNKKLLGVYQNTEICAITNNVENVLLNATIVAKMFNFDLQSYLKGDEAIYNLKFLFDSKPYDVQCSENSRQFEYHLDNKRSIDDIIVFDDNEIYIHHMAFRILICAFDPYFQHWYDNVFYGGFVKSLC